MITPPCSAKRANFSRLCTPSSILAVCMARVMRVTMSSLLMQSQAFKELTWRTQQPCLRKTSCRWYRYTNSYMLSAQSSFSVYSHKSLLKGRGEVLSLLPCKAAGTGSRQNASSNTPRLAISSGAWAQGIGGGRQVRFLALCSAPEERASSSNWGNSTSSSAGGCVGTLILIVDQNYNQQGEYNSQIQTLFEMDINELLFLGTNKYGQAGIGEKHHNKTFTTPKSFAFPTFIKQISCGAHHSALLTIDGHVYTMGSNIHGALGSNPNLNYSFAPTLVDSLHDVTKIQCGPFHMCAISEGSLYSWGKGIDGQLGHGNTKNLAKPARVQALGDCVDSASCGTNHTLVILKREGRSECFSFGNGIYGQLGTGQSRNSYSPARVKLEGVEGVAAGDNHSLFIQKGRVFGCGDNSNGQLGALFAKKFNPEPTKVQFQADNDNIITVQAKKYSLAITDSGEMFVWGLKSGFGAPKRVNSPQLNVEVIDGRLGSDKCYGLSTKGSLYSWEVFRGQQGPQGWLCESETVVSNSRAVLDFSVGQGYILILGDIVKQVEYSSAPPSTLSCFEDVEPPRESSLKHEESQFRESQIHSLDSSPLFSGQESQFDRIKPQSLSPAEPPPLRELPHSFLKQKPAQEKQKPVQEKQDLSSFCLNERKDFNNLLHFNLTEKKEDSKGKPQQNLRENLQEDTFEEGTFDHGKSYSSSIQCEPTNFLKESLKESLRIEQSHSQNPNRVASSHPQSKGQIPTLQELRKARAGQRKGDKENQCEPGRSDKRQKNRKIDKIMQLLEKSNHIGGKGEEVEAGKSWEDTSKDLEIIKTNRILRVELREKELKISQMQELLSRKEMEIEAQRELIKLLREKNASNFASLEPQ